jgi:hypothetical protein
VSDTQTEDLDEWKKIEINVDELVDGKAKIPTDTLNPSTKYYIKVSVSNQHAEGPTSDTIEFVTNPKGKEIN